LDCVRWELLRVDASGAEGTDELFSSLAAEVRETTEAAGDRLLAAGVTFEGVTALHTSLAADPERLRYNAISAGVGAVGDQVFIERIRLQTEAPEVITAGGESAVGELVREIEELSGAGISISREAIAPLVGGLPGQVKKNFDPADDEQVRMLLGELKDVLPARLLRGLDD
jgi:hypothetical protein